jgi:hypothetical protein
VLARNGAGLDLCGDRGKAGLDFFSAGKHGLDSRSLPDPQWQLHYGKARMPMVSVVPDDHWPGMYRLAWPDGQISDLANLSRTKDAAVEICERGPPRRDIRLFRWKIKCPREAATASPVRLNGGRGAV